MDQPSEDQFGLSFDGWPSPKEILCLEGPAVCHISSWTPRLPSMTPTAQVLPLIWAVAQNSSEPVQRAKDLQTLLFLLDARSSNLNKRSAAPASSGAGEGRLSPRASSPWQPCPYPCLQPCQARPCSALGAACPPKLPGWHGGLFAAGS